MTRPVYFCQIKQIDVTAISSLVQDVSSLVLSVCRANVALNVVRIDGTVS